MADIAQESLANLVPTNFGIDQEVTKRVQTRAKHFVDLFQRSVLEGWELGKELTEVKAQLPHGYFLPWVETEIGLARRTAQRLMDLYARDPDKRHVALFKSTSEALRLLPPAKPKSEDGKAGGRVGKTLSGNAKRKGANAAAESLATSIARLEPILFRIRDSRRCRGESDLRALFSLTALAATTVDKQLQWRASDKKSSVELPEEVVVKLRALLETVSKHEQDERIS